MSKKIRTSKAGVLAQEGCRPTVIWGPNHYIIEVSTEKPLCDEDVAHPNITGPGGDFEQKPNTVADPGPSKRPTSASAINTPKLFEDKDPC